MMTVILFLFFCCEMRKESFIFVKAWPSFEFKEEHKLDATLWSNIWQSVTLLLKEYRRKKCISLYIVNIGYKISRNKEIQDTCESDLQIFKFSPNIFTCTNRKEFKSCCCNYCSKKKHQKEENLFPHRLRGIRQLKKMVWP